MCCLFVAVFGEGDGKEASTSPGRCAAAAASGGWDDLLKTLGNWAPGLPRPAAAFSAVLPVEFTDSSTFAAAVGAPELMLSRRVLK